MLASVINPTKAARESLKAMNIDLAGIVKKNQGNVMGIVQGLKTALDALPADQRLKAIEQTFGKFQFARVTALLNNLGTAGSQSAKVLELYGKSNAELSAVAQQELDVASKGTPAARFQKMKETLKADLIPLGQQFLEAFTRIGTVIGNIIDKIKRFSDTLGPIANILGKVLGTGLAGLIIIGPIIMLTGLFANLIGNILRGANSIRMFVQGMNAAAPAENKFMAGLHGMRNFYETLDKSSIAARNQMELMPEAITSNAKAFDILSKSIMDLTGQFEALALAQRESMGMGGGIIGPKPFNVPFRAPGFATGIVGLPGSGNRDTIPAMLAPGESVMTAKATSQYSPVLSAMNSGKIKGFVEGGVNVRGHLTMPFDKTSLQFTQGIQMAGYQSLLQQFPNAIRVVSNLIAEIPPSLNAALVKGKVSIESFATQWSATANKLTTSAKLGGADITDPAVKSALVKMEQAIGERTAELAAATETQTVSDELLAKATKDIISKYQLLGGAETQAANALSEAALQIGQVRFNLTAEQLRTGLANNTFQQNGRSVLYNGQEVARVKRELTQQGELQFRPASNYRTSGNYEAGALQGEKLSAEASAALEQMIIQAYQGAQRGIQTGIANAAQMHSPAETFISQGETMVTSTIQGMESKTDLLVETGGNLGNSMNAGAESKVGESLVVGEQIGDAVNRGIAAKLATFNSSMMGKMAIGTGMSMGGMTAGNALGGLGGSMLSSAGMWGGMAVMMKGISPLTIGLTALAAAVPLVTGAFKKISDDIRIQSNSLKGSLQISSSAAQYFGIKFTPLSQYDFSKITDSLGKHVQSIKDNRDAVDKLTQAYLDATDQITKDLIKSIKNSNPEDQSKTITNQYLTNLASGMTPTESKQNITAMMNAVGMGYASQQGLRTSVSQYDKFTPSQAASTLLSRDAEYASDKVSAPRGGMTSMAPQNPTDLNSNSLKATIATLQNLSQISSKSFDDATKNLDSNRKALLNTNQVYDKFAALVANGDSKMVGFTKTFRLANGTTTQLQQALRLLSSGLVSQDKILGDIQDKKFDKTWLDNLKKLIDAEGAAGIGPGSTGSTGGGGDTSTPVDYSKEYQPLIKHLTDVRKLINAQSEAQKKYNDQLKATQDYQQKQLDYFNQMKNAYTSGNFLGAAQIKDSAKASQADFADTVQQQKQSDALANLDNLLSAAQDASTGGSSFASWAKANPGISRFTTSKYDSSLLGGVSPANYSKETNGIISKANSAQQSASAVAAGGTFQNLVINVSADNSVIPAQFAQSLAAQIQSGVQKAYAKANISHKVGTSHAAKGAKVK